ncbi:MAG: 50S ribosomal protein L17 [Spirochaetes bacterium]|nr:50S ribosomal protein L17 [Spirochaetota bacterium]
MRHRNSVKQLGRTHAHRKAMFNNMVTSFFKHERITTTKEKGKILKKISERLITRAKKNIGLSAKEEGRRLHNKREVMKVINDRDIVKKLFEDIAPRFKDRNGGYTRIYLLGRRPGDAAEMSIVELVEKAVVEKKAEDAEKGGAKEKKAKPAKAKKEPAPKEPKKEVKKEAKKEEAAKEEPKKEKTREKSKEKKSKPAKAKKKDNK